MYRQFGSSAVLLLLFTSAISHVMGPGSGVRGGTAARQDSGTPEASTTLSAADADLHTCFVFETLRRYFGASRPASASAKSGQSADAGNNPLTCTPASFTADFPSGMPEINGVSSQVLIATVPDPLETSEALQFDRDIAALQEAASTAGYDFEWMTTPWRTSDLTEPKDLKEARDDEHYRENFGDQPGAMLFRKRVRADRVRLKDPDSLLLLVLVPESPIYGLNLPAAREGLSAVRTLLDQGFRTTPPEARENSSRVRWIGPNYSASAPGLRILQKEVQPHTTFDILSGTITTIAADAFLLKFNQEGKPSPDGRSNPEWQRTSAGVEAKATLSELDLDSLCWFLGQELRSGIRADEPIAVLQEDETAYGSDTSDNPDLQTPSRPISTCDQPSNLVRRFTYPRGISRVRSVYGSTLKNASANQSQPSSDTGNPSQTLSFRDDLEDPLDTVPEFAQQSPVSNESVLAAIASGIKHIHARAIVIRSSDPLDQLFLARYFRNQCPDSRLVLFNAERLLTRLRGDFNLDGTLIVTRFPLFQNSYLQTPYRGESRHSLTFTSSREEAIFLAALLQIKAEHLQLLQSPFAGQNFAMAPWIGIAAGGDFWPVAYLGKEHIAPDAKAPNNVLLLNDTPPEPLPALWTLILLAVLILSFVHFFCFIVALPLNARLRESSHDWKRRLARHHILSYYLFPLSPTAAQSRLFTGQCWWLLNLSSQLILLLSYLLLPAIAYQAKVQNITSVLDAIEHFPFKTTLFASFTLIGLMLQFCMAGALFFLLSKRCAKLGKGFFVRFEGRMLPGISLLWVFISLGLFCWQLVDTQTGFAFASRCLHLSSGACPVLPLLLISCGFMIAAIVNLSALSMGITRNPELPLIHWPYIDLEAWRNKLTGYTELWYGLPGADGLVLAASVLLACLLLHPQRLFATFDTPAMAWLYTLNFILIIWTVLWLWIRFIRIWGILRGGLDCLEGSPLRFAFSRLPTVFSIDPIWTYAGLRRVVVLPMRWFEYLKVAPAIPDIKQPLVNDNLRELRVILQEMRDAQWVDNQTYAGFSHRQNQYALRLAQEPAILASWERGGPDCSSTGAPAAAKAAKSDKEDSDEAAAPACSKWRVDIPPPCGTAFDQNNCMVELGNEYIAMRIAAYIRYVTLQMKNLMTFMSLGFLFALLAAISYPFDHPQIISWSSTLILAALLFTVGTVLAQMDRDAVLSRLSDTVPGQVRYMAFLKHMLAVGGLPLLTVLATLFPSIGSFLFSWAAPVVESLH